MQDKIFYSEKLQLNYKIKYNKRNEKIVVFQDGVNYFPGEMNQLKNCSNQMLKNVHLIKLVFEGVVI